MPYNPGITDRSGEILAAGIAQAAQEYASTREKMQLTQKEIDHLTGTVDFAAQKGVISPEQLQQFAQGNLSKKREIASMAGMMYQDMQANMDRATLSPEMAAELKAAGYLAAPAGGGRLQYLQMPDAPWQPSAGDLQMATDAGLVPVPVAKGRFQFVEKPNASGLQVTPIPGTDYVAPTMNGRSLGTLPVSGSRSFQPTAEMIQAAMDGGYQYLQTDKGMVLRAMRGGAAPSPAQDTVNSIYAQTGKPTPAQIKTRQDDILKAISREVMPLKWSDKNAIGETLGQEMQRLARELEPTAVRTTAPKPAVKPSAGSLPQRMVNEKIGLLTGDRTKFAGPTMPASDALLVADPLQEGNTGEVLPPLPDDDGIPTLSPDEARKLPAGTKFRTLDGRVMTKG